MSSPCSIQGYGPLSQSEQERLRLRAELNEERAARITSDAHAHKWVPFSSRPFYYFWYFVEQRRFTIQWNRFLHWYHDMIWHDKARPHTLQFNDSRCCLTLSSHVFLVGLPNNLRTKLFAKWTHLLSTIFASSKYFPEHQVTPTSIVLLKSLNNLKRGVSGYQSSYLTDFKQPDRCHPRRSQVLYLFAEQYYGTRSKEPVTHTLLRKLLPLRVDSPHLGHAIHLSSNA